MQISILTNIPGTPRSSFGHVLINSKLYVAGGHPGQFHVYKEANFSSEFHVYDITSSKWSTLRSLPRSLQGFRMVSNGKYIYAFGGFSPDVRIVNGYWPAISLDTVLRYSIIEDKWEEIGSMPHRRSSYVCQSIDNLVFLIGGWDATPSDLKDSKGRFIKATDVFDLDTEKFVPSGLQFLDLRTRRAFTSTKSGGRIIMAGGLGTEGMMASDLFGEVISFTPPKASDVSSGSQTQGDWTLLPSLPYALFSPGIGALKNDLIVAGGVYPLVAQFQGITSSDILIYRNGSTWWESLPVKMSEARSFVEVQELPGGKLLLIGGHHGIETDALPSNLIEVVQF